MKISIVTISYNQAEYLERAILSVIKQRDLVEIEYIVVDAGSNDDSRKIIEVYSNDIDHIVLEPDDGPSDGLNKGFELATGDIFGYLNADDEYSLNSLSEVVGYFENHLNIDVISGHGELIDENNNVLQHCFSHKFNLQRYAEGNCVLVQQSTFFRSATYHLTTGFNRNNRVSWDGELMVDMAVNKANFTRVHKFWSKFRIYSDSISGSGAFLVKAQHEHERIMKKIGYTKRSRLLDKCSWLIYRLSDPVLLYMRIKDGIKNGRRIIPS